MYENVVLWAKRIAEFCSCNSNPFWNFTTFRIHKTKDTALLHRRFSKLLLYI